MSSFYIAASSEQQNTAKEAREDLQRLGHTCTSRWHFATLSIHREKLDPEAMRQGGIIDLEDISSANVFIMFTWVPNQRGGRHVEMGYALGLNKPMVIIGPLENNPFQFLSQIRQYDSWKEFLETL